MASMLSISSCRDLRAAFERVIPGSVIRVTKSDTARGLGLDALFPRYALVVPRRTRDIEELSTHFPIIAPSEEQDMEHHPIFDASAQRALQKLGKGSVLLPSLLGSVMHDKLWELPYPVCHHRWRRFRHFNRRDIFQQFAEEAGIPTPARRTFAALKASHLESMLHNYGSVVVQTLHDSAGKGTSFVKSGREAAQFMKDLPPDTSCMVSQFVDGIDIACTGCVMPDRVFASPARTMLVGDPALTSRKGQFCGNDWTVQLPASVHQRMQQYVEMMGEQLRKRGYRGLFGLDAMWDKKADKIYCLEINPRVDGSVHAATLLDIARDVPPLLGLHVLAHLDVSVTIPDDALARMHAPHTDCAHMMVFVKDQPIAISTSMKPGVYSLQEDGSYRFIRSGYSWSDVGEGQFLLTNIPLNGSVLPPQQEICRIMARFPLTVRHSEVLSTKGRFLVQSMRKRLCSA